jgi:RimJ/RimL family protein N-acetyltransferase
MASESDKDSPIIRTKRLILIPFKPDDEDELLRLFCDADVRRYLLDDQLVDRTWVDEEVQTSQQRFTEGWIGIWSIRELDSSDTSNEKAPVIGFSGFRPFFDPPELQLIYGLLPSAWGSGYATESARAAIDYGIEQAGLDTVVAATDLPNVPSIGVMERLGMKKDRITDDGDQETVFYRLDCDG